MERSREGGFWCSSEQRCGVLGHPGGGGAGNKGGCGGKVFLNREHRGRLVSR